MLDTFVSLIIMRIDVNNNKNKSMGFQKKRTKTASECARLYFVISSGDEWIHTHFYSLKKS